MPCLSSKFFRAVRQLHCVTHPRIIFVLKISSSRNVPGSEDSLPRYMSDSMSTLQLGSIKQRELDPLHPLALLYGSGGLSYESISSYASEMSYPRAPNLPSPSPGAGTGNSRFFTTPIGSSSTVLEPSRTTQPRTRVLGRGTSSPYPGESPVVILRTQVFSCMDMEAKDSSGFSNPYVIVSGLGKQYQTPVCERNLNPVYEPKDATFDFPIYKSLLHKPGTLKFVVWSKGKFRDDYLGEFALPVDKWFKGTALAFNDPNNRPFFVNLASSRRTTSARGAVLIKSGFVQPPDSKGLFDFGQTYNALILAPPVGAIVLEICGAKNLPKWPNMVHMGWDMDPFVEVSIDNKIVGTTPVIQHSRNPVWEKQLCFPLHKQDLSFPIQLTVIDRNKLSKNDYVGVANINIAQLIEIAPRRILKPGVIPT
ncbi:C2 domain-containing protein [Lactarius hengduanensis]|nr:C2 domain-containing protein [Lactarius hengduanensis]